MGELEDYLRGDYLAQLQEIDQVSRTVSEVLPVLNTFYREHQGRWQWPYEVVRGETPRYPDGYYSFSTSAMNLAALATALGSSTLSAFKPRSFAQPRPAPIISGKHAEDARSILYQGIRQFIAESLRLENIDEQPDDEGAVIRVSTSRTYGDNDPLTLVWILQALQEIEVDDHIASFRDRCRRAAAGLVDAVYRKTQNSLRHVLQVGGAVEHVFPLLYVVQLHDMLRDVAHPYTPVDDSAVLQYLKTGCSYPTTTRPGSGSGCR